MSNADLEYKKILEDKKKRLETRINALKQNENNLDFGTHYSSTLRGLEHELEETRKKIEDYENREAVNAVAESGVAVFETLHGIGSLREEEIHQRIVELKAQREQLLTARARRKTDRKINRLEEKLKKIQKKVVFVGGIQRKIMLPSYAIRMKRQNILSHAEGRVKAYEEKIHDNNELQKMLDPDNHVLDGIKSTYYDLKGKFYKKRLERSNAILNEMKTKNNIITMYGSRITSLAKGSIDYIRDMNNPPINLATVSVK